MKVNAMMLLALKADNTRTPLHALAAMGAAFISGARPGRELKGCS